MGKIEEDEFEDFNEDEEETEEEDEEEVEVKPVKKIVPLQKKPIVVQEMKPSAKSKPSITETEKQEPQYIPVPRAVTEAEMLNTIYDGQQEIRQLLRAIYEKLR